MHLGTLDEDLKTWMSHDDVPLQVGHEGWNWAADRGTWVNCLSMAKTPEVRDTHKAGPMAPRLEVMVQRRRNNGERMGRHHRNDVAWRCRSPRAKQDAWKDSRVAGVRSIALCRVLTGET